MSAECLPIILSYGDYQAVNKQIGLLTKCPDNRDMLWQDLFWYFPKRKQTDAIECVEYLVTRTDDQSRDMSAGGL